MNMGTSFTSLMEGVYEGKHLKSIIKHIQNYKHVTLSSQMYLLICFAD